MMINQKILNITKKSLTLRMDIIIMNQYVGQEMKAKKRILLMKMQQVTKQQSMMYMKISYIIIGKVYSINKNLLY